MATIKQPAPISLETYDGFIAHPRILSLQSEYAKDSTRARFAVAQVVNDLETINEKYFDKYDRVAFTTIEGRVKTEDSFFRKLYKICCTKAPKQGLTAPKIQAFYFEIKDLCGIRFSCPYFDEVELSIEKLVRPRLSVLGYATDLQGEIGLSDKNYLEAGDELGYRSYHFFISVPTVIDIFGNTELCLCEVQARTELQHVWAVKSHDLLYKPKVGWDFGDDHITDDMKHLSHNLRFADEILVSIRDRTRGKKSYEANL